MLNIALIILGILVFCFSLWRLIKNIGYKYGYEWDIDAVLIIPAYIVVMAIIGTMVAITYSFMFYSGKILDDDLRVG
jgi:hypothetical protein